MTRQRFLTQLLGLLVVPATASGRAQRPVDAGRPDDTVRRLDTPTSVWRTRLSTAEYEVLFEGDTEPPGSSPLNDEHRDGTYICAACYLPLFDSDAKFESGTGWPSFTAPIAGRVETQLDFWLILPRTEYHCARCGGHQGHVFDDGPPPTGERWCNNGLALDFVPRDRDLPSLRS